MEDLLRQTVEQQVPILRRGPDGQPQRGTQTVSTGVPGPNLAALADFFTAIGTGPEAGQRQSQNRLVNIQTEMERQRSLASEGSRVTAEELRLIREAKQERRLGLMSQAELLAASKQGGDLELQSGDLGLTEGRTLTIPGRRKPPEIRYDSKGRATAIFDPEKAQELIGQGKSPEGALTMLKARQTGQDIEPEFQRIIADAEAQLGSKLEPEEKVQLRIAVEEAVEDGDPQPIRQTMSTIMGRRATDERSRQTQEAIAERMAASLSQAAGISRASVEDRMRGDYEREIKPFKEALGHYTNTVTAAGQGTPSGDIALIFSFMKQLDPISVVREGEQDLVRRARSVVDSLQTMIPRLQSGEKLTPTQREDIKNMSRALLEESAIRKRAQDVRYKDIAGRRGLEPLNIIDRSFGMKEYTIAKGTETATKWLTDKEADEMRRRGYSITEKQ